MRSAVVVGAGVAGLATAGALARAGWQVTLLERAERVRPPTAAMLLWPNGVRALHALGLGAGLDAIATPVRSTGLRRPDGRWLRQPDQAVPVGGTPVVVHRADLHDAFIAGLGDRVEIVSGVAVRGIGPLGARSGDARAAVTNGSSRWEADLVVAADGTHSTVRGRLAPPAAVVSGGASAWRAVIPWYRAPVLPAGTPAAGETIGAGQRFMHASLGDRGSSGASSRGGIYWLAVVAGAARPEPAQTQLALLRRWFTGWHPPIGDLLAAAEPDDLVQDPVTELHPMPQTYGFPAGSGGYVLVGDAAHTLPDHLGVGACLALEDAATLRALLLDAVPGPAVVSAVEEYSRLRLPRIQRLARQSRRIGAVLQVRGRLTGRARDMTLGSRAPRLLAAAAAAAADWQPPRR